MIAYYIKIAPVLAAASQGPSADHEALSQRRRRAVLLRKAMSQADAALCRRPARSRGITSRAPFEYCLANNLPTLVWAANLGDLELHTFLVPGPACPSDPPNRLRSRSRPAGQCGAMRAGRLWLREMFDNLGLEIFIKSSGSKGMQVYVPLNTPTTYKETTPFAKAVAQTLENAHPELVVSDMKKALRHGKVLVDWSQNSETKTTVCVYSLRAKDRPFVSMPLEWGEVENCLKKKDASLVFFEAEEALETGGEKGRSFRSGPDAEAKPEEMRSPLSAGGKPLKTTKTRLKGTGDGSISAYNAKRDFTQTAEPAGKDQSERQEAALLSSRSMTPRISITISGWSWMAC